MIKKEEKWLMVPHTCDYYEISNHGRVRSRARTIQHKGRGGALVTRNIRERILVGSKNHCGYHSYNASVKTKRVVIMEHKQVARLFVDNPHNYGEVNHINGIKADNYYENLEWVSHGQNMAHAKETGLLKGRDNSRTLDWDDACTIRELYAAATYSQNELARMFCVTQPHINNILAWRTWQVNPEEGRVNKLSQPEADNIREQYMDGVTEADLAILHNCTKALLLNVLNNRIFKVNSD